MKVNHKQLYNALKTQERSLLSQLNPETKENPNEIPEDFNVNGWNLVEEKLAHLTQNLIQLKEIKGNRLTPPFYRTLYNRCNIAIAESENLIEKLTNEAADIDYEKEVMRLTGTVYALQEQLHNKTK